MLAIRLDYQDGIYVPTIEVLRGLRKEGFEPFMVAQSKSRIEGRTEFTKHMIRMRHAAQVDAKPEANEIILIAKRGTSICWIAASSTPACAFGSVPLHHRRAPAIPGRFR